MNGKVIELKEVPDEAFAQKMVGDGCAIEGGVFLAFGFPKAVKIGRAHV